MSKIRAYLTLMRPPNLLTAVADILAGFSASASLQHVKGGAFDFIQHQLPWDKVIFTGLASICLYAGGVVLNDVFDAKLDRLERPERPIPSGVVSGFNAALLGGILLLVAILLAFSVNMTSGYVALTIVVLVILYDGFSKSQAVAGPLNMGLCRGANLMLGVSIFPENLTALAFLTIIPVVYVAAITVTSRGEVHGSSRSSLDLAFGLYLLTITMMLSLGILETFNLWSCIPFLLLLMALVFPPLFRARQTKEPRYVGKAVKFAVLSLIILNAALAAGFVGWFFGLLLLLLLPFSILLAKAFAVT